MALRWVPLLGTLAACGPGGDSAVVLPPEDSALPLDTGAGGFIPDDSGEPPDLNQTPEHTLTIRHFGAFTLGPAGGPYETLQGELRVQEYLDGLRPTDTGDSALELDSGEIVTIDCDLLFVVDGVPSETNGPGLAWTFDLTFTLASGEPSGCHDPEIPRSGDLWRMGLDEDPPSLWLDVGDAGLWTAWYDATVTEDDVLFEWIADVAVSVEEEEEE